jgi:hypothetical protein
MNEDSVESLLRSQQDEISNTLLGKIQERCDVVASLYKSAGDFEEAKRRHRSLFLLKQGMEALRLGVHRTIDEREKRINEAADFLWRAR